MRTQRIVAAFAAPLLAFALGAGAQAPAASPDGGPSADEMLEALRMKPLTRSIKPGGVQPRREGKLQLQVQFEFGSAELTPKSRELLKRLAGVMKDPALSGLDYRIEGHTDSVGTGAANLRLSQRRAESVRAFLAAESGVDREKMDPLGFGAARLLDPQNPTAAANRRVVVVSLEPLASAAAAVAAPRLPDGAATIEQARGEVQVQRGKSFVVVGPGSRVREGDLLQTGRGSSALVRLDDGAKLLVRAETALRISKLRLKGDASLWSQAFDLVSGAMRYVTGALGGNRPDAVAFSTSLATVGVRGTDIDMVHAEKDADEFVAGTYVKVNDGAVVLGGKDGSKVQVGRAEQAVARARAPKTRGGTPEPSAVVLATSSGVFKSGELDELLAGK